MMYYRLKKFQILLVALGLLAVVMACVFVMLPLTLVLMLVSGVLSLIHIDFVGDAVHCLLTAMMKGIRRTTIKIRELTKKVNRLNEQYGVA